MHSSSIENMKYFIRKYVNGPAEVLDVGSQEIVGQEDSSYKRLFPGEIQYMGCDLVAGNNVDIVLESSYDWKNIQANSYKYVISGQMLEHVEFPWLTFLEITRILKYGGICCMIAPSAGPMHNYPLDCYRYYPDGMVALAHYAHLDVLEVFTNYDDNLYPYVDKDWKDTVLIARKPDSRINDWKAKIKRKLLHCASPKCGWKRKTVNPIG